MSPGPSTRRGRRFASAAALLALCAACQEPVSPDPLARSTAQALTVGDEVVVDAIDHPNPGVDLSVPTIGHVGQLFAVGYLAAPDAGNPSVGAVSYLPQRGAPFADVRALTLPGFSTADRFPAVASLDGGALFAWECQAAFDQLCTATLSPSGSTFTFGARRPVVALTNPFEVHASALGDSTLLAWGDTRLGGHADVSVGSLSPAGVFAADGGQLARPSGSVKYNIAVAAQGTEALVGWYDTEGSASNAYLQRYGVSTTAGECCVPLGAAVKLPCCIAGGGQLSISAGGGGWLVVWEDSRAASRDVYAALYSGALTTSGAFAIATTGNDERHPAAAFDGQRHQVAWFDNGAVMLRSVGTDGSLTPPSTAAQGDRPVLDFSPDEVGLLVYERIEPVGSQVHKLFSKALWLKPVPDGGVDAGPDAGADAGRDAGGDGGADAGADAGNDAGTDGGADAGNDAGVMPGADGGLRLRSTPRTAATCREPYRYSTRGGPDVVGEGPYTYRLAPGTASDVSIDPDTGVISWVPTEAGTHALGVVVRGAAGEATQQWQVEVTCPPRAGCSASPGLPAVLAAAVLAVRRRRAARASQRAT